MKKAFTPLKKSKIISTGIKKRRFFLTGFTLIEMLVTIAIITIITAVSAASLKNYKSHSYFNDAVSIVHGEVLKAQSLAMASTVEGAYGYKLTISGYDYNIIAVDESGADLGKTLDSGIVSNRVALSGTTEFIFSKDGSASAGDITVTDTNNPLKSKKIVVTGAGSVELQ